MPMSHTMIQSFSRVIDIKLGPYRRIAWWGQKGASSVNKLSMKPKGVRAMTIIECVVHISSNRSEGQCLVIVTNEITKAFVFWLFRSKKLIKLRRNGIEIGRFDFALITAYAKLGISL